MTIESPDLMHTAPADRRQAIWPWLVMPLIALTAFYCLERLAKDARDQEDLTPPAAAAAFHADSATAAAQAPADTDSGPDSTESK